MLWVRDGHLGVNRDMIYRMVSHQRKEVHPFPYVDCCLPIADWNDLMWSTNGIDPSIGPKTTTTKFEKELKDLHAADVMNKLTAKELTWAKQHACLYNKHKQLDRFDMLRIQCRIKAMTKSSRNRLDRSAKLYEKDTDGESDEDGQFPGEESTLYTSRATRRVYRRGKLPKM